MGVGEEETSRRWLKRGPFVAFPAISIFKTRKRSSGGTASPCSGGPDFSILLFFSTQSFLKITFRLIDYNLEINQFGRHRLV